MTRSNAERKQFRQRKDGLMKKANELRKICSVEVAVMIKDGDDCFLYLSDENWPFWLHMAGAHVLLPDDFTTVREASLEKPHTIAFHGPSSSSSPTLIAQPLDDCQIVEAGPLQSQIDQVSTMDFEDMDIGAMCQQQLRPKEWPTPRPTGSGWHTRGHSQPVFPCINPTELLNKANQYIPNIGSQSNTPATMASYKASQGVRRQATNNGSGNVLLDSMLII